MISRTNVRCPLCHNLMKFVDLGDGKSHCDNFACLVSALGWTDTDTFVQYSKAQLLVSIIKELESNIGYDTGRIADCEKLLEELADA